MKKEVLAEINERRQIDPVLCLLMWATSLNGDGPREVLKGLGVYHDELYAQFGGREYEFAKLRQLRMVGEMFNREFLAKLLRARLAELLMQCSRASDFTALMRAVKIMPEWVLDEQPGVDQRTEDPAFDDIMNQPLEDEDGNRLAPDFGTLSAAGPSLAERIYEQMRAKRAPGEVVADANVGENGANVGENGADVGENGAEGDVGAELVSAQIDPETNGSRADTRSAPTVPAGNDPASTWKGSPTPCPESTEAVGAGPRPAQGVAGDFSSPTESSRTEVRPTQDNANGAAADAAVGAELVSAQHDARSDVGATHVSPAADAPSQPESAQQPCQTHGRRRRRPNNSNGGVADSRVGAHSCAPQQPGS